MIDVVQLLLQMARALHDDEFSSPAAVASRLDIDLASAMTTVTGRGSAAIVGGSLTGDRTSIDLLLGNKQKRSIDIVFRPPVIPISAWWGRLIEMGAQIEKSKHGDCVALVLSIHGDACGVTASSSEGGIETLFCQQA